MDFHVIVLFPVDVREVEEEEEEEEEVEEGIEVNIMKASGITEEVPAPEDTPRLEHMEDMEYMEGRLLCLSSRFFWHLHFPQGF